MPGTPKKNCDVGVSQICRKLDFNPTPSTARYWLRQRDIQGSLATREDEKATQLGWEGRPKYLASNLQRLTNQQDLIHKEPYEIQAKTLDRQPSTRTLQAHASQAGAR